METIKETLRTNRPSLSDASITTYGSIFKSLYDKAFLDKKYKLSNFSKVNKIIETLSGMETNTTRTILSALFILTGKNKYHKLMMEDINKLKEETAKQELNEKQTESWVTQDEVNDKFLQHQKKAEHLMKKTHLTISDLQDIQDYVILALLGGIYIPPRRSKDYVDFVTKNPSENSNFLKGTRMFFNSYKTAHTYGTQVVSVPSPLLRLLKKWISINPTDYLLFDKNQNQMTNVKLNQRLNKIFDKKVGVNQLRHTYLTDKYKDKNDDYEDLEKDFKSMGSSVAQRKTYIKTSNVI